jgi:hypothetical protein
MQHFLREQFICIFMTLYYHAIKERIPSPSYASSPSHSFFIFSYENSIEP